MPGPAAQLFAKMQAKLLENKNNLKHAIYKTVLDAVKGLVDAKSAPEAGVKISAELLKAAASWSLAVGVFGADALTTFVSGKVVDKAAQAFVQNVLEGHGVKLKDGTAYTYDRTVGDSLQNVIHHIGMLAEAEKAYDETMKSFIKSAQGPQADPARLYKKLCGMIYSFQALLYVWLKVHHDAAAVKDASVKLEEFVKKSSVSLTRHQEALLLWVDEILKETPGLALAKKA